MILHTINKSSTSSTCLQECIAVCAENDSILLIEDGVYAVNDQQLANTSLTVYALQADIEARGLSKKMPDTVTVIDDAAFVELSIKHNKVVSWY